VKGAQAQPVRPGTPQLHRTPDERHDVRGGEHLVDGFLRNATHAHDSEALEFPRKAWSVSSAQWLDHAPDGHVDSLMSEETNPYKPPATPAPAQPRRRYWVGCMRGTLGCGCLVPLVLFIIAAISGDVGGPLFWPILMVLTGLVGAALGVVFAPLEKKQL
jgi:hypothetical protein